MKKKRISPPSKPKEKEFCHDCIYCTNPRNLSVDGVPTLGICKFKRWAVLWRSEECDIGKYEQAKNTKPKGRI